MKLIQKQSKMIITNQKHLAKTRSARKNRK